MENIYQERSKIFREKHEEIRKQYNFNSFLRGIAFIALIWLLIFYFRTEYTYLMIASALMGVVFYLLVLRHKKLLGQASFYSTLSNLNQEEIKRTHLDLSPFETGNEYLQENHAYQMDLDIFGNTSLYQLVNRCEIDGSKELLADWLSSKAPGAEIKARQQAVNELTGEVDWRQEFSADCRIAISQKKKHEPAVSNTDLLYWIRKKASFARTRLWRALAVSSNLALLILTILVLTGTLAYQALYIPLILNGAFLGITLRYMSELTKGIDKSYYIISTYKKALERIESKDFKSPKLISLKKQLFHEHFSASKSIQSLSRLTHRLNSRTNMLYVMADVAFLLDAYLLVDLHNWRKKHCEVVGSWLAVVNETECLISLAGFSHSNPEYSFPEITDRPFYFEAKGLGHPLIAKSQKVANDYTIDGQGSVDIITGSNMSGKSTFQRTIGINMVLAQLGAPVDAKSLTMGLTEIFTSMRTKDNLAKNTSSFYAELKRIRQLLDDLEENEVTFFLLDEILKGTNSEDRQKGAISLAKKLTNKPAFGLISTHDLMLGQLAEEQDQIRNFSFNSEINGNKIAFDYRLTEGLCKSFNATKLMENMGIM